MKITKETYTELHVIRARGSMAAALMCCGIEPTMDQRAMLDRDNWSLREIAEFYHALGFHVEITLQGLKC